MLYILNCIAYLLTGCMDQSPSWETNRFSTSKEIPPILWKPNFHYSIHECLQPVPILSPYQWINPGLRHQFIIHNMSRFYGEELFAPHPSPKLEYYRLSAVRNCLFNIFAATLHNGGHFSIHNMSTCNAFVTFTHLSCLYFVLWWIYYIKWLRRCIVSMYNKQYFFLSSW